MPKSRIDDLNPEQLRAATTGEGPVLTIAGAGTGKTKTLASRVAWLVSQGIDPGRIMLLTFTRRASDEMLRRARRALGETASRTLGTVWGGTFHSVANRLLRAYGEAIGLDPDFTVMDQSDAEDLMDASRHDHALGSKEKRFPRKQTCLSIYSRCVNSSDHLDHTLAAFFPWCIEWEQELRLLFKSYTEAKQERHVLDYDDLLLYWFHLLGDETLVALLNGLAAKAQHSGSRVSLFDTVVSTLSSINPKEYGRTCETASKSGKRIERSVISIFRIAWSTGSKGEFRQREHLLALPLRSNLTADW